MVVVESSFNELNKLVGKKVSKVELEEMLFNLGFELESLEGDGLRVEITAERPDLLSTQGLARAVRSYLGLPIKKYKIEKAKEKVVVKNAAKEWPFAVACIVKGLKFDDEKIKEVIRIQEKLGATFLRQRKKGGLGLYPLEKIKFPVTWTAEDPKEIIFRPLEYKDELNGLEILEKHPTGQKYKHIMEAKERGVGLWKKFPVFRGADKSVLSMPPITNSHELGKIDEGTKDVFVEATGVDLKTIILALEVLVGALADMGGKVYALEIDYGNKKILTPEFKEEKRSLKVDSVNKILGLSLSSLEIKKLLLKMGYEVQSETKREVKLLIPGTRSDIWHDIDVIDDIARAYGFNNFKPRVKPVPTTAETTSSVKLKEKLSEVLIGLNYQEVFTLITTSSEDQFKKMNLEEKDHIKLGSTVEQSVNMVRLTLLPELMKSLKYNRSVPYPQALFEINQVVVPDVTKDVLAKDFLHLALVSCHSGANFTQVKQVIEVLAETFNINFELKPSTNASFILGRAADLLVDKKVVGVLGEIHPQVLENWELSTPTVALEINLTELFKLI